MKNETPAVYTIPLQYRKMENLHIVFWLFKDIAWCIILKPLGVIMIFPTLIIAVLITIRTGKYVSELCHNLAIVFWITANSYWMISEFLGFDSHRLAGSLTFKHLALLPFAAGVFVLAWYYIWWKPRHKGVADSM